MKRTMKDLGFVLLFWKMHEKAPRDLREINHIKMRKRKDEKKSKLILNAENCIKSYVLYLEGDGIS